MSFLIPKKPQILYAPMLSSFGGGSARGFNPGGGVDVPNVWDDTFPTFSNWGSSAPITSLSDQGNTSITWFGSDSIGKIVMEPGGTRVHLAQYSGTKVATFTLSTAYDISTISSSPTSNTTYPALDTVFAVDPTGNYVMAGGRSSSNIYELNTEWDVTGGRTLVKSNVNAGTGSSRGHWGAFGQAGEFFGLYSDGSDYFQTYQNSTVGDYSTASVAYSKTGWLPDGSNTINAYGGVVSADGKALCTTDFANNNFHFWEFGSGGSAPWNATQLTNGTTVTNGFNTGSGMGLCLVREGGTGTAGQAYMADPYNDAKIRQISFTWAV